MGNLGNARLQGLESQLGLVGDQFNVALVRTHRHYQVPCSHSHLLPLDDVLHCKSSTGFHRGVYLMYRARSHTAYSNALPSNTLPL